MKLGDTDVREIIRLLDETPYRELELETASFRLVLRRDGGESWTQQRQTLTEPHLIHPEATSPAEAPQAAPAPDANGPSAGEEGLQDVLAPIVGTFYRAPAPGAAPFVEIGSRVDEDTVVAIIEVMKLMNSVPAGVSGEVAEICVENAELVEQGQCLIRVRPVTA